MPDELRPSATSSSRKELTGAFDHAEDLRRSRRRRRSRGRYVEVARSGSVGASGSKERKHPDPVVGPAALGDVGEVFRHRQDQVAVEPRGPATAWRGGPTRRTPREQSVAAQLVHLVAEVPSAVAAAGDLDLVGQSCLLTSEDRITSAIGDRQDVARPPKAMRYGVPRGAGG